MPRLIVVCIGLLWISSGSALAAPADEKGASEPQRASRLDKHEIDERTGKRLEAAKVALSEEDWDEAERALSRLRQRSMNPLERQKASEIRAFIAFGRGDNAAARGHFEDAIAQGLMTTKEQADARFMISQLYLADQMWPEVIDSLNRWFAMVPDPAPNAYYNLAIAHYQNGDLEAAIAPGTKALDLADAPQEGWLQLMLAIRLTRKEYKESIPLLDELLLHFPSKRYWLTLSTVYGSLENYPEALIPLQLAYTQGLLTEDAELRRLAQLMLFLGLPYRAAEVLETGIENKRIDADAPAFEALGNSWIAAREFDKTVEPLSRAAEISGDGDLFVRLAQVQIQREQWFAAATALRRALELGQLDKPGDAKLLMGIAVYNSDRPKQAKTWFRQARAHEETRGEADQWLLHLAREQQQSS